MKIKSAETLVILALAFLLLGALSSRIGNSNSVVGHSEKSDKQVMAVLSDKPVIRE